MRYFLLLLIFMGCCTAPIKYIDDPGRDFDPVLEPYYYEFIKDAQDHNQHPLMAPMLHVMRFVDLFNEEDVVTENQIAFCATRYGARGVFFKEIQILKSAWHSRQPFVNKAIAYHELGHCIFNAEHSDIEHTIMFKSIYGDEDYWEENWKAKVDEEFRFIEKGDPLITRRID